VALRHYSLHRKHINATMSHENKYIWGIHSIEEALNEGQEFSKILINRTSHNNSLRAIVSQANKRHIPIQKVPIQKLNAITRKNHQGIVGIISPIEFYLIEDLLPLLYETGKTPLFLILDGVTDMRNFGAIVRSAAAMQVDAIILPERGSVSIDADAVKTSAGTLFKIKIARYKSLKYIVNFLRNSGLEIVAATEKGRVPLPLADLTTPLAIVMGAEGKGISEEVLNLTTQTIVIPQADGVDSLNVSVATGIILYETQRQRAEN